MRKLTVLVVGLGIALSTTALTFGQDTTKKESGSGKSKTKKGKAPKSTEQKK